MKKKKYRQRVKRNDTCIVCQEDMETTRVDKMTCSARCRQIAHRILKRGRPYFDRHGRQALYDRVAACKRKL